MIGEFREGDYVVLERFFVRGSIVGRIEGYRSFGRVEVWGRVLKVG